MPGIVAVNVGPPDTTPHFTVALCTWNRAERLRLALESHAAQCIPPEITWELIVVDNGSTDHTPAVIDAFAGRLPLRHVCEPRLGLSHARNAAVCAARGRYILWTDDDVLVGADWVQGYARAVRRWPGAVVFGGPIRPLFDPEPPKWLVRGLDNVGNALALLDYGPEPVGFAGERLPYGANYAVRTAEQRRHAYAPWLGRSGTSMAGGEEWAVIKAILAEGAAGWWVPWIPVRHLVPAERQTVSYLRRYYIGAARASPPEVAPNEVTLFGRPRWVWRQALQHELLYQLTRHTARPERWTRHVRHASSAWGLLLRSNKPHQRGRALPSLPGPDPPGA